MATSDASETRVRVAAFEELSTDLLYQILRLRVDVFVVEQRCPYPDLDGRDTDPTTRHVWAERDGAVLGYLRIVVEPDVRNHLALRRLEIEGFTFDSEIEMPDKRAQLAFLTRARFAERHPTPA